MTARRKGEPQDAAPPPTEEPVVDEQAAGAETAAPPEADATAGGSPVGESGDEVDSDVPADAEGTPAGSEVQQLERALAERTADLQRLQAEYVNYKRRVDRDRELVRENAAYATLAPIVEVLDTIDRARESARSLGSDLDDGFSAVAEQLERVVAKAGLVKYGEVGDPFDPRLHEALSHIGEDPDVEVTTCKVVAKAGYRIGERVVRAAQVLVVDPVAG